LAGSFGWLQSCVSYQELVADAVSEKQLTEIRAYLQQQRALGSDRFQAMIEVELGRCTRVRPAHRPRTSGDSDASDSTEMGTLTTFSTPFSAASHRPCLNFAPNDVLHQQRSP
jgi:hypothetical protein